VVVPIPGFWRDQIYQHDLGRLTPPLSPVFVLDYDTFYFGAIRSGLLVTSRQSNPGPHYSLAAVTVVQPGTISGLRKSFGQKFGSEEGHEFVYGVTIDNGPAVWVQTKGFGCIVPTPDPVRLAAEIDRRRWRVARLGSPRAAVVWRMAPELRVLGPDGPEPGKPDRQVEPPMVRGEGGTWTPLHLAAPDVDRPTEVGTSTAPEPLTEVPYPETVDDRALPLRDFAPRLVVNVSNHRVRLSQQPLAAGDSPFLDQDIDYKMWYPRNVSPEVRRKMATALDARNPREKVRAYLSAPIVQFPVISAGTLNGVPADWSVRVLAPDAQTEIRTDIVDGPAVWLWGVGQEWVLCTTYAEELAADLRQRRRIASLFPLFGKYSAEFMTWATYPDTALIETEAGWCLPPTPPYAPREPTIVPPGTWHADPE
jgi:hypothetical protein